MGMIQIRNVPEDLHRKLKARAAKQGVSLSELLLRMAEREADRPTIEELTERIRERRPARRGGPSSAEIIRELREDTA
jgi:plasmid stability protein